MGKNILIISSKSADFGGLELHVLDLIKAFADLNKVYVLCPNGSLVREYEKHGAVVYLKTPRNPYDFSFAVFVKNFCAKNKINVVHSHELISALGLFGAFLASVKIRIWHVHTPFLLWQHKNVFVKLLKSTLNFLVNFVVANFFATKVVALTPQIKNHRLFCELVWYKKIVVIPNAVDVTKFIKEPLKSEIYAFKKLNNIPTNKIIIGNMSRTSAEKGQIYLLKAFNLLNKKFPNKYFLLIAGGGDLQSTLTQYANENFKNDYLITGKFKEADKVLYLKVMDIIVFPSLAEGFGYVLVESMASGRPVVSSNISVLKYVGGSGVYYFKSKDYKNLYSVLQKVLFLSPAVLLKNKQLNITRAQNFSFNNFKNSYSKLYQL